MPEKFRSAAEMPEPSKPSSAIGSGNEADRRLIRALTDCEPLDWTRRLNGDLVYQSNEQITSVQQLLVSIANLSSGSYTLVFTNAGGGYVYGTFTK